MPRVVHRTNHRNDTRRLTEQSAAMKRHHGGGDVDDDGDAAGAKASELLAASAVTTASANTSAHSLVAASTATTRTTTQRETEVHSTRVPFGSLVEAFGYVVFLVLFLLATCVVDSESERAFYFANRLRSALVAAPFAMPVTLRSTTGAVVAPASAMSATVQKSFGSIQDQSDVWAFLEGPFADVIYGPEHTTNSSDSAGVELPETAGLALSYNRVLGGVRLRTLRIKPESCPTLSQIPEYASVVPYCYANFASHAEDTSGYGPILNSGDVTASRAFVFAKTFFAAKDAATKSFTDLQVCLSDCTRSCGASFGVEQYRYVTACATQCGIHCKCIYEQPPGFDLCADPNPSGPGAAAPASHYAYNWSSSAVTGLSAARGYTGASYPGSGYVVDLAVNSTLARSALAQLRRDRFVDLATRALMVDVTIYNAHLQLFNIVQLVAEFPATGGTLVQLSDDVLRPFRYSSRSTARIVLECFVVAYVAWCWKRTLQSMLAVGSVVQFVRSSVWHSVTLLFLLVITAAIALRLYAIDQEYGTLSGRVSHAIDSASLSESPRFEALARLSNAERILESVTAALVWLKLLQYTQVSKRMCLLLHMLARAARDLFWFFLYFVVCICGFAQIAYLLFGLHVPQFRSLGTAIVTLLQAVAGDLDYRAMRDAHRVLGPLFYIAYYLLLLLVLLNVFLAILNDAYLQTITEQEEADARAIDDALIASETSRGRNRSHTGDDPDSGDAMHDDAEARLQRHARREMAQLRQYPFSHGLMPALRLLTIDLKLAIYELRTGRKAHGTKVDPFVIIGSDGAARPRATTSLDASGSSRKWTTSVKKQLDTQLAKHSQLCVSEALEAKDAQMAALRSSVDKEISERLVTLVESNRQKTQRMGDLEHMLGSIERLCQQLITDTAYLRDESDETNSARLALGRPFTGATQRRSKGALGMSLPQNRRSTPSTPGARGEAGMGLGVSTQLAVSPNGRRPTAVLKPQSLSAALSRSGAGGGSGSSKRLLKKGSGAEEIEEITL